MYYIAFFCHSLVNKDEYNYQPTKLGNSRGSVVKALDFHSTSPASAICGGRNCSHAPENSHLTRDCMEFKELILYQSTKILSISMHFIFSDCCLSLTLMRARLVWCLQSYSTEGWASLDYCNVTGCLRVSSDRLASRTTNHSINQSIDQSIGLLKNNNNTAYAAA